MAIPIDANPALADLLEWYCRQRIVYNEKFYNNPLRAAMWSFAPYDNSGDWQAAATLSAWLLEAYTRLLETSGRDTVDSMGQKTIVTTSYLSMMAQ
jgi:hypothetical protein